MSHAQLGDDNLLIVPGTTDGVLEVEADHSVLVLDKELLHSLDGALHRDRIVHVHHREGLPPQVGVHDVLPGELPALVAVGRWEHHWSHEDRHWHRWISFLYVSSWVCLLCRVRREMKVNGRRNKRGSGGMDSRCIRMAVFAAGNCIVAPRPVQLHAHERA